MQGARRKRKIHSQAGAPSSAEPDGSSDAAASDAAFHAAGRAVAYAPAARAADPAWNTSARAATTG